MGDTTIEFPAVAGRVVVEVSEFLLIKAAFITVAFFTRAINEQELFEIALILPELGFYALRAPRALLERDLASIASLREATDYIDTARDYMKSEKS